MPSKKARPPQHQRQQPGREHKMVPRPKVALPEYRGSGKLDSKAALITGGDSSIGRAVAVLFAREGADVAIIYLAEEEQDARETADPDFCRDAVERTVVELGRLDLLVNNAAYQ